jgi:diamine N-acetyltransferase
MNILENDIVLLRALEPEDIDFLFQNENDTSLWKVSETQKPFSRHILNRYLENSHLDIYEAKQLRLMIIKKETNERIGMVDLFDFQPQHHRSGIGILITDKYRDQGFAHQALGVFIRYAFTLFELRQIYANIPLYNKKSISLFEKLKFERTGIKKEWILQNEKYEDVAFYQLFKENL